MAGIVSIVLSLAAVVVSATTAWLTLFQRGTVRMTQPTVIYFGPDAPTHDSDLPRAKVYLRTLLYATSKRGRIVENMFVRLRRLESSQTFNIWVHGEESLTRGSGLFVGETGVLCNHHFLLPAGERTFRFQPGEYALDVYVSLVGDRGPRLLFTTHLTLSQHHAEELNESDMGVYFDWGPDSQQYFPHLRPQPKAQLSPIAIELLRNKEGAPLGRTPPA